MPSDSMRAYLRRLRVPHPRLRDMHIPNPVRRVLCMRKRHIYDDIPGIDWYYIDELPPRYLPFVGSGTTDNTPTTQHDDRRAQLDAYLQEIERLDRGIEKDTKEKTRRNFLVQRVRELRLALAPITALPDDLIVAIFNAYLEISNTHTNNSSSNGDTLDLEADTTYPPVRISLPRLRAPFVLSAISRDFRTLALRTPTLWTYVGVPTMRFSRREDLSTTALARRESFIARWTDLVQLLITRSGDAGLEIHATSFYTRTFDGKDEDRSDLQVAAMAMLAAQSHRFRSLHIAPMGKTAAFWKFLARHSSSKTTTGESVLDLGSLKTVVIERANLWELTPFGLLENADDAPPLGLDLRISALARAVISGSMGLLASAYEYAGLTTLCLSDDGHFDTHVWSVLSHCAATLEDLSLNLTVCAPDSATVGFPVPPNGRVEMPKLRTLRVMTTRPAEHLRTLMRGMTTPVLRKAGCRAGPTATSVDDGFTVFLDEVESTSLTALTLSYGSLAPAHGTVLRTRFPQLVHLRLEACTVQSDFLSTLRGTAVVDASPNSMERWATDVATAVQSCHTDQRGSLESLELIRCTLVTPMTSILTQLVKAAEGVGAAGQAGPSVDVSSATPFDGNVNQYVPEAVVRYR